MKRIIFRQLIVFFAMAFALFSSVKAQKEELKLEILNGHSGGGVLSVAVSNDTKEVAGKLLQTLLKTLKEVHNKDSLNCKEKNDE